MKRSCLTAKTAPLGRLLQKQAVKQENTERIDRCYT